MFQISRFSLRWFAIFAICFLVMTSQAKRNAIKRRLTSKGWTQSEAAKTLGVTFEHLNRVLNGHRESGSLLKKLEDMPVREEAPTP